MSTAAFIESTMEAGRNMSDAEITALGELVAAEYGAGVADSVKLILLSGSERFRVAMFDATYKRATA